jgi:Uma2 family endonuclease
MAPLSLARRFVTNYNTIKPVHLLNTIEERSMSAAAKLYVTPEDYLARERQAETKSEYYDGEIFAMAGGNPEHSLISANVGAELNRQLFEKPCRVYNSDLRVRATESTYVYPDVTVVCGEPVFDDPDTDVLLNPTVIVEVLSETTEAWDRGGKFERYRERESLQEYLLVAQDRAHLERYARQPRGEWLLSVVDGLDKALELPSLGCRLELARVYHMVTLPADAVPRP